MYVCVVVVVVGGAGCVLGVYDVYYLRESVSYLNHMCRCPHMSARCLSLSMTCVYVCVCVCVYFSCELCISVTLVGLKTLYSNHFRGIVVVRSIKVFNVGLIFFLHQLEWYRPLLAVILGVV